MGFTTKHTRLLKSEFGYKMHLIELLDDNGNSTKSHYEVLTPYGAVEVLQTQQAADTRFADLVRLSNLVNMNGAQK